MVATRRLLLIAAVVRASYLAASLLLAHHLNDYDTSTKLTSETCGDDWPELVAKSQQTQPWVLWDSVFFQRISTCGYEFEQYYAFFPGLPGLVCLMRKSGLFTGPNAFSVITLLFNNALFLLSVVLLARLSELFLQDDKLSATSVLLFIASPASIHHGMLYTEALFTACSWLGLYCLYWLLNAGFILHEHGKKVLQSWQNNKAAALSHAVKAAAYSAISMAPYCIYMAYGYKQLCTGVYGGEKQRPWCSKLLPSAYGYVQDVYWDVGFLRYYRPSQIPNFLIASPTLIISLWGALAYATGSPHSFLTGGLLSPQQLTRWFSRCRPSCNTGSQHKTRLQGCAGNSSASSVDELKVYSAVECGTGCVLLRSATPGWRIYICNSAADGSGAKAAGKGDSSDAAEATAAHVKNLGISGVAYQSIRHRRVKSAESSPKQQRVAHTVSVKIAANNYNSSPTAASQACTCASAQGYYSTETAVFVIHWLLLTLVCLAVMHIQVATRFLSSCAPLYWFAALLIRHRSGWLGWLLWLYCFTFMGLGAVYFTNFYPWT